MKKEVDLFLKSLKRSPRTVSAYHNALEQFIKSVGEDAELTTETYIRFLADLKNKSASTQRVYTTAVLKFYAFCRIGDWIELKDATANLTPKSGNRMAQLNRQALERVISYCEGLSGDLLAQRDRAFVLTLVDTGLRISEACALKHGDINWKEKRTLLTMSSGGSAIVRFSARSIDALDAYLQSRTNEYSLSRTPLVLQPLFARHDIRASRRLRPISAGGMWKAIKARIVESGLDRRAVRIHDFRNYFVAKTYRARGDLRLSQELARHRMISSTVRLTHVGDEADEAYDEIFNRDQTSPPPPHPHDPSLEQPDN